MREIVIDYTNYKGMRSRRRILPHRIVFEANQWHPKEQWLLIAFDLEKDALRSFALTNIHSFTGKQ